MYEYIIINETSGHVLGYTNTDKEARDRADKEGETAGSHRITVTRRVATLQIKRVWS